jgi:hypothetical protein
MTTEWSKQVAVRLQLKTKGHVGYMVYNMYHTTLIVETA